MMWTCKCGHRNLNHWQHCADCGTFAPPPVIEKPKKETFVRHNVGKKPDPRPAPEPADDYCWC